MATKMKSYRMSEAALSNLEGLKYYNHGLSDAKLIELSLQLACMISDSWEVSKGCRKSLKLNNMSQILEICRSVELI